MTDEQRSIELDVEVPGTPDEVWQAIATGPGITSWYVPHEVEEREGGRGHASFGPDPEMQAPGRVAVWDPPNRIVFDGGEGVGGMAFEWTIEARDGGTCVVRLVNSGFGAGEAWDDQFDAMTEGWKVFLTNLRLHREHFPGRHASALIPFATWKCDVETAWSQLTDSLGVPNAPELGEHVEATVGGDLRVAGTVQATTPNGFALLLDDPAEGTGFVLAEAQGDQVMASVWTYVYGDDREAIAERDEPRWRVWLQSIAPNAD